MTDETGNQKDELTIPYDFPRRAPLGSVAGFQPKLLLSEQGGEYTNLMPDDERAGRFLMCSDLLQQMVEYTQRKAIQNRETPMQKILDSIETAARKKGWEVHDAEFDWIFARLRARFIICSSGDDQ